MLPGLGERAQSARRGLELPVQLRAREQGRRYHAADRPHGHRGLRPGTSLSRASGERNSGAHPGPLRRRERLDEKWWRPRLPEAARTPERGREERDRTARVLRRWPLPTPEAMDRAALPKRAPHRRLQGSATDRRNPEGTRRAYANPGTG